MVLVSVNANGNGSIKGKRKENGVCLVTSPPPSRNLWGMGHCVSMAGRFQISEYIIPGLIEAVPPWG